MVFLVAPAPPLGCHLLVVMSSLHALSPPPLWVGPVVVLLALPCLCGAVCSTETWYGCCRLLAVMSSLRARYHTKYDVALFSLRTVFSTPVKKHWLGSFSIVLPPSGLRGFVPVWEQGRPGAQAGGGIPLGGGWGPDPRASIGLRVQGFRGFGFRVRVFEVEGLAFRIEGFGWFQSLKT